MQKEQLEFSQPTEVLSEYLQLTAIPEMVELLFAAKGFKFKIKGSSMYPALHKGDVVKVEPVGKETVEVGDLLIFRRENRLICHRLVEIFEKNGEAWLRTKGDAGTRNDPPLRIQEILGKVTSIERNGKTWEPSRKIQRLSLGEVLFLSELHTRTFLSEGLIALQSLRFFRLLYRWALKPNVAFTLGVHVTSSPLPEHFRYFPHPSSEEEKYLKGAPNAMKYRFLAKKGKGIVGSLELSAFQEDPRRWSISHLFVRRRYRGCGIATALLKQGFQLLRRQEVRLLEIKTLSQNRAAISFFKRHGFSETRQKETTLFQKEFPFPMQMLEKERELEPFFYCLHSSSQPPHLLSHRMKESRKRFITNAAKQLVLEQALFEIDAAFKRAGIDFLMLKGMAIAYFLYPDPAARPMSDMDVYLHKNDVPLAAAALKELGYQMHEMDFEKELMTFGGELSFLRQNSPMIELHWCLEQYERLKDAVTVEEDGLWGKAMTYSISGRPFKTLCPEHQLLSLSIHLGLIHRFRGLKWFLDIDRWVLTFGKDLNWEELSHTARRWGVERVVGEVLRETELLFHTPLPPLPLKRIPLRSGVFQWLWLDRPLDRLRVLWRIFFPSHEWLVYRYRLKKRERAFCYRFLHPLLVLAGKTR